MAKSYSNHSAFGHHKSPSLKLWIMLALLAAVAAAFGGASRYDVSQIVPLRAISTLFLIPAFYFIRRQDLQREAPLLTLFSLFVIVVGLQLIPLPPEIWQALPGRDAVAQLDRAVGIADLWRPLSMAPLRTWNAFGSLVLPASGLLLAVALRASSRDLLLVIAGLGVLNAALGLLQVISGPSSPLYFYEVTNRGSAVGIFANENHSAVFAACSLLVVARLGSKARIERNVSWVSICYSASFLFIILIALISRSRAGFVACLGSVLISILMAGLSPKNGNRKMTPSRFDRWREKRPYIVVLLPLFVLLLTVIAFVALGRAPAFDDILAQDSFADLRLSLLPVLLEMTSTHWLVGSGLGSFEQIYQIYEPSNLLMPQYVNQAHNDWMQLIMEGGVLIGGLLLGLGVWVVRSIGLLFQNRSGHVLGLFWISILGIIAAASLVDYPMRTPIFQLVLVWLLLILSSDRRDAEVT